MGGRADRGGDNETPERELWIQEVSDSRLTKYERMLASPIASRVRVDGEARAFGGAYFRDLIQRERERRSSSLF
jgi:hypothetical protein